MKKFAKVLSFVILAAAAVLLASCDKKTTVAPTTVAPTTVHEHVAGSEWKSDADYHWHECTAGDGEVMDKAAHTWGEGVVTTAATYEADGVMTYTCTVCGATKTEAIAKLEHKYSADWSSDADNHWHACTDEGYADLKADSAAHTWDEGKVTTASTDTVKGVKTYTCSVCGATKTEELPLAYSWAVGADSYYTQYDSKQADTHYTYSMDGNVLTIASHADWGWNAIVSYASGKTAGYGLQVTVTGTDNTVDGTMFVNKLNDSAVQYLHVTKGTTTVLYFCGSDLVEEMTKMVVMLYPASTEAKIEMHWVKLEYSTTATYALNANNKVEERFACTTAGFEKAYNVGNTYELSKKTIAEALALTADTTTPFIIEGYVTELVKSVYGNFYLVDAEKNLIQVYGTSKAGTGFAWSVASDVVTGAFTNAKNFSSTGDTATTYLCADGDKVSLLVNYDSKNKRISGELLSADSVNNLQNSGYEVAAPAPTIENATLTADKEKYAYGDTVTLTFAPTSGYYVKSVSVQRASGAIENAVCTSYGKVFTYVAGVYDTVTPVVELYKYSTSYKSVASDYLTAYPESVAAVNNVNIPLAADHVAEFPQYGTPYIQFKSGKSAYVANTASVGVISSIALERGANKTDAMTFAIYASAKAFTAEDVASMTPVATLAFVKQSTYAAETQTADLSGNVYQYFAIVGTVGTGYLDSITVSTAMPTANVTDIMSIGTNWRNSPVAFNGGKVTVAAKGGWVGPDFASPVSSTVSAKYLVAVVSCANYDGQNGYGKYKLDDTSNTLNAYQFDLGVTEVFQVIVIDITADPYTNATFLGNANWKFLICNYDTAATQWFIWQAYIITAAK